MERNEILINDGIEDRITTLADKGMGSRVLLRTDLLRRMQGCHFINVVVPDSIGHVYSNYLEGLFERAVQHIGAQRFRQYFRFVDPLGKPIAAHRVEVEKMIRRCEDRDRQEKDRRQPWLRGKFPRLGI